MALAQPLYLLRHCTARRYGLKRNKPGVSIDNNLLSDVSCL